MSRPPMAPQHSPYFDRAPNLSPSLGSITSFLEIKIYKILEIYKLDFFSFNKVDLYSNSEMFQLVLLVCNKVIVYHPIE